MADRNNSALLEELRHVIADDKSLDTHVVLKMLLAAQIDSINSQNELSHRVAALVEVKEEVRVIGAMLAEAKVVEMRNEIDGLTRWRRGVDFERIQFDLQSLITWKDVVTAQLDGFKQLPSQIAKINSAWDAMTTWGVRVGVPILLFVVTGLLSFGIALLLDKVQVVFK